MNVCHIVLGRPWYCDKRVIHDGYQNTHSFVKDGRKITLTLLSPHKLPKNKPSKPTETPKKHMTLIESELKATRYDFRPIKG